MVTTTAAEQAPKAFTTLQAQAALQGYSCTRTEAGNLVLSRFGGGWIFDTIEDATGWLDRQGAEVQP